MVKAIQELLENRNGGAENTQPKEKEYHLQHRLGSPLKSPGPT